MMKRTSFLAAGAATALAGCAGHHNAIPPVGSATVQNPFPARGVPGNPILGEAVRFDGSIAPSGWMFADGRTLNVTEYPQLFSLFKNQFGGDGKTTFNLPKSKYVHVVAVAGAFPTSPSMLSAIFVARSKSSTGQKH